MSDLPTRPPHVTGESRRFWEGTAEGRIELPHCGACDLVIWYPRAICPDCHTTDLGHTVLSGRGTIYSFTVMRGGASRRWREHLPYVIAYVELEEGPRLLTNIVDVDVDTVHIGQGVVAVFDDTGEESAIIRFTPAPPN